jgi:hypothetical protein
MKGADRENINSGPNRHILRRNSHDYVASNKSVSAPCSLIGAEEVV